jgi:hypothetical protein
MNAFKNRVELTAMNIVNAIVGAALFLSPWLFGFDGEQAASWNAWIGGLLVAIIAVAAVTQLETWEEWVNLAIGLWLVISPWVLGFTGLTNAFWGTLMAGLVVAVLAAVELWMLYQDQDRPLAV